jgi:hypothetical protein
MEKIENLLKDPAVKKILLFFNDNPNSIDTAKGIALWTGCDIKHAQAGLDKLEAAGIVVRDKTLSTDVYAYTSKRAILKKIESCIKKTGMEK